MRVRSTHDICWIDCCKCLSICYLISAVNQIVSSENSFWKCFHLRCNFFQDHGWSQVWNTTYPQTQLSEWDPWGYSNTKVTSLMNLFWHEREKEIYFSWLWCLKKLHLKKSQFNDWCQQSLVWSGIGKGISFIYSQRHSHDAYKVLGFETTFFSYFRKKKAF